MCVCVCRRGRGGGDQGKSRERRTEVVLYVSCVLLIPGREGPRNKARSLNHELMFFVLQLGAGRVLARSSERGGVPGEMHLPTRHQPGERNS